MFRALLDGEHKSIEPMATRIPGAGVQPLPQFVGQSLWAVEQLQRGLAHKMVDLLSEAQVWIIDGTAFPKAGTHSVGLARQYCSTLGGKWRSARIRSMATILAFAKRSRAPPPLRRAGQAEHGGLDE